jgi:hypothetical protein
MNPHYNFLLHFSEFRKPDIAWAYIHRESLTDYWNGTTPDNGIFPIYGPSPEECMQIAIEKNYHKPI